MALSEFPGVKTPPKYTGSFLRFMNPVLDAMRDKGGQARPREIYDAIAHNLNLSDEERGVLNKNGRPRFENEIAWARSYFVKTGYMDSPDHGVWRLTDKGKEARLDGPDIDMIWQSVQQMTALAKAGGQTTTIVDVDPQIESLTKDVEGSDGGSDDIAPSPQTSPYSNHRPSLIALIGSMSPAGFEEFCSTLLARCGVEDVQTTRYSKDGGIDGTGRLRINEFVSQQIAFQAKKFDVSESDSNRLHEANPLISNHLHAPCTRLSRASFSPILQLLETPRLST